MSIKIDVMAVCRNCGKSDQNTYVIASWNGVKNYLEPIPLWECPSCGCQAAFWYYARNWDDTSLSLEEKKAYKRKHYWQIFDQTTDVNFTEGKELPNQTVTINSRKINLDTGEDL